MADPTETRFFRAILAGDAPGVSGVLETRTALVHTTVPDDVAPEALGRGRGGNTALHLAAFCGFAEIEDLLIDAGAELDRLNLEGRTPLHVALEHNTRTTEHLIARGATVDVCAAAALSRLDRLAELLDGDPLLANDRTTHLSPLGWAAFYGATTSAELLIVRGARMDDGELFCAAMVASAPIAKVLLRHGYDVNARNADDGATALHFAVTHRHTGDSAEFVRLLLASGADLRLRTTRESLTPLELARRHLRRQAHAGIERGDPRWRNFEGVAALLEAAG